jgi:hypothetical protein
MEKYIKSWSKIFNEISYWWMQVQFSGYQYLTFLFIMDTKDYTLSEIKNLDHKFVIFTHL